MHRQWPWHWSGSWSRRNRPLVHSIRCSFYGLWDSDAKRSTMLPGLYILGAWHCLYLRTLCRNKASLPESASCALPSVGNYDVLTWSLLPPYELFSYDPCMYISLYLLYFFLSAPLYLHLNEYSQAESLGVAFERKCSRICTTSILDFEVGYVHWWPQTGLKGECSLVQTFIHAGTKISISKFLYLGRWRHCYWYQSKIAVVCPHLFFCQPHTVILKSLVPNNDICV